MFTLYIFLYIVFYLLGTLSLISVHKRLVASNRLDEAYKLACKVVEDCCTSVLNACGSDITVYGKRNILPNEEKVLYVGNHQSMFDILVLIDTFGAKPFMAKSQLLKVPILRYWAKAIGCVFVNRDSPSSAASAMRQAKKTIEETNQMVIFPEGTRSHTEELLPFKEGAFRIAKHSGCAIVPFSLSGTGKTFELNKKRINKKASIKINFMPAIKEPDYKIISQQCFELISSSKAQLDNDQNP